jgi:tetratricopeptide (TPR) repeat protein
MLQTIFNPTAGSMEGLTVFLAAMVVLLTGVILADQKEKKDIKGKLEKLGKIGVYLLLLAILGLLVIIDFNPAWLMILLSLFLFLTIVLWKRIFREDINKLLLPILLVILSAVFLFVGISNIQGAILKHYLPQEQALGQRTSWQVGLKSATENIKSGFLGSGLGTFHYGFAKFKPVEFNLSMLWQIRFDRAGSHIAEILGTMGFLGLLSYLALVGMFLLISYLFLQQNKSGIPLLVAFLVLLAGQFVFYQNTVLAFAFWLVLGLSVVNWQKPAKEKIISFKDFPELSLVFSVLLIILVLAFAGMYFFAAKFYLADVNYRKYFEAGEGKKLEKAVELNPYQSQYRLVLARDYLDKVIIEGQKPIEQIDEAVLSNNIYSAITFAKEATELSPNRVATWETLAIVYREIRGVAAGALDWGIKSFEKAIELEPTNPALHTELGKLYFISGERDKAKERFNKAKELMPDYVDASIQMALIYEVEENVEEAIKQMEELVAFYPYNIEAIFQLGRLYLNNNRLDEAISQLEWAIKLFPNHSNSIYSLGLAYQRKGEKEKAIAAFEKVLELNPGNEDIIQKLEELKKTEIKSEKTEEPQ